MRVRFLLVGVAAAVSISGCGGGSDLPAGYGQGGAGGGAVRPPAGGGAVPPAGGGQNDPYALDCGQLKYLADKYSSIADSAAAMNGDSPAATAVQLQGMQAAEQASRLYSVMIQKGC